MTTDKRRPRVGDPAPEDLFDPLDAIDVLLGTMPTSEAGAISLTNEDLQTISAFLRQARAERRQSNLAFNKAIQMLNEAQMQAFSLQETP